MNISSYLSNQIEFPHPDKANEEGLLALGGDLSVEMLISAYAQGVFPWFNEDSPILWWSPDPRLVLFPSKLKVSKSLKQQLRNKNYTVQFDRNFEEVIKTCAKVKRNGQDGTWITQEMISAYLNLHTIGVAHSVEIYNENKNLVGGLYGVSLGKAFFGESMFHLERDTSKMALYYLVKKLITLDFDFIDAQQSTDHLKRLGAEEVPRNKFLEMLKDALKSESVVGNWV